MLFIKKIVQNSYQSVARNLALAVVIGMIVLAGGRPFPAVATASTSPNLAAKPIQAIWLNLAAATSIPFASVEAKRIPHSKFTHHQEYYANGYLAMGQAVADINGDSFPDMYVTDNVSPNQLYINTGNGASRLPSMPEQVALSGVASGGASFVDYDNDGIPKLYALHSGARTLFRNDDSKVVDVTDYAGVGDAGKGETAAWGDYDQDGSTYNKSTRFFEWCNLSQASVYPATLRSSYGKKYDYRIN